MNVPLFTVFVNSRFRSRKSFLGIGYRLKDFIIDIDQVESLKRRQLLARDNGGARISHVPYTVDAESLLGLADGKNPVLEGNVLPRHHERHTRRCRRPLHRAVSDES